jgi:hypothetical protein
MSKFEYGDFYNGYEEVDFVANAKKYTKEQTINLCIQENDWKFKPNYCGGNLLRMPTICDVKLRYVKWYIRIPDFCGYDGGGGCYTYCKKGERGSFPVWVIKFEDLEV